MKKRSDSSQTNADVVVPEHVEAHLKSARFSDAIRAWMAASESQISQHTIVNALQERGIKMSASSLSTKLAGGFSWSAAELRALVSILATQPIADQPTTHTTFDGILARLNPSNADRVRFDPQDATSVLRIGVPRVACDNIPRFSGYSITSPTAVCSACVSNGANGVLLGAHGITPSGSTYAFSRSATST